MFFLRHPFFVIFTVALLESMLLAKIGSTLGWGITIALILLSTIVGSQLVRQQGFQTFQRLQLAMARGENPGPEMLEGVLIMVAGLLLITPGFISDGIGFVLLIPFTRKLLINVLSRQFVGMPGASTVVRDQWTYDYRSGFPPGADSRTSGARRGDVYEGEGVDIDNLRTAAGPVEIIITTTTSSRPDDAPAGDSSGDDVARSRHPDVLEGEFTRKED